MKIIDFEKHGNVVRFYIGKDTDKEYCGDDWNDAPYDANAGNVYVGYVVGCIDVAFSFDALVLEPCDSYNGDCWFSKNDLKERKAPCIVVVPSDVNINSRFTNFSYWSASGNNSVLKIYYEDNPNEVFASDKASGVAHIIESYTFQNVNEEEN